VIELKQINYSKRFTGNNMKQDNYIHFPLMTVGEAAKYLGVGRKVVYQLIEFGQIQSVRENRAILIEKRSLDRFRQSGTLT
jgi:excisionase family DNA binding protein